MKRKPDDNAKELNQSSRHAPIVDEKNSRNREVETKLQAALELLGAYRTVIQELRQAINGQNEAIRTQQGAIQDLKDAAEEQHTLIRDSSQQLQDNQKQTGDDLERVHEQLEAITATKVSTPQTSFSDDVTSSSTSPRPSYARVLSSANTAPTAATKTVHCTIDASMVEHGQENRITAGAVRALVEHEVRAEGDHVNRAVTTDVRNRTRLMIICRDGIN